MTQFYPVVYKNHPVDLRYPNLSQCHGMSGLGEVYLEAARVLKDSRWLVRAAGIGTILMQLARKTEQGSVTWLVVGESVNFERPKATF
jgi:hypothetical protein